ncbi:HD domain-containing protein [Lignipirellula cremea]|uniref:N-methyl-D-aspartate receptor NMDAR2C subunit n=1 Tax=Lignipirellula cremea TaxID=2528010 RepID=A0A518DY73_9BACT|nr:N-methyl-D-aspartate receptor NMDAR2C subunit [Lignipirellula cremea]QDU96793.1 hypothetical protein Pla8534_46140 [Lignipirellula cremea]
MTSTGESESRWQAAWQAVEAVPPPDAFPDLLKRYAEPVRAYHNLQHVLHCLIHAAEVQAQLESPGEVLLAIWYHDAIYDPRAHDNEAQSAGLATDVMRQAGVSERVTNRVSRLILATDHRNATPTGDAAWLVDIDLAILAAPGDAFWAYEAAIRREYAWVPEEAFRQGRADLLERFLERPAIYATAHFCHRWEAAARENLRASADRLRSG